MKQLCRVKIVVITEQPRFQSLCKSILISFIGIVKQRNWIIGFAFGNESFIMIKKKNWLPNCFEYLIYSD